MECLLMPMPIQPLEPCTLGGPRLGMDIDIINSDGTNIRDEYEYSYLVTHDSCSSMTRSLWSGDERYLEEYLSAFENPQLWDHGDCAQMDEDDLWFLYG